MADFQSFLQAVNDSIRTRDGVGLSRILALPLKKTPSKMYKQLAARSSSLNIVDYCASNVRGDPGIAAMVGNMLLALESYCAERWEESYDHEITLYESTLTYFKESESNWSSPVLITVSNDLRCLASVVDTKLFNQGHTCLRKAISILTTGFQAAVKTAPISDPDSKKVAIFGVTNCLLKIYFKLDTLHLCGKLINAVERPGPQGPMQNLHCFPLPDVVTYKYYIGKLRMFEDKYVEARDCLLFALNHCPKSCQSNIQLILTSLIPVNMFLGVMPTERMGRQYNVMEYITLGQAVIRGDLKGFEETLRKHQKLFIYRGVYLVFEQIKIIAYRNLVKKIYKISSSTRIRLDWILSAMQWMEEDVDLDEVECIVANLIYQGKIKGYISHEKRTLIISKADPFPRSGVMKG